MDQVSECLNTEVENDEESNMYKGSGLSCLHGSDYQLKLLMLFLLRAIKNNYTFRLATEIKAAEKFDDVVFQYTDVVFQYDVKVHVFLQAKHKQDEEKRITVEDFITKRGKAEYYLPKYFISYLKIKHNSDFADSHLRDFILCTNIELDLDPATPGDKEKRVQSSTPNQETIFVVVIEGNNHFFGDRGSRYRVSYHNHNNIISVLKKKFEETLKDEIEELKKKRAGLQNRLEPNLRKELNQIQQWLGEFEKIKSGNMEEEMKEFFKSLVLAVGQPNETMLTQIMQSELRQEFTTNTNCAYARFYEHMHDWLKKKDVYSITQDDGLRLFDKLRVEILGYYRFNVQSPVESFFGRNEELKTLDKLINQDGPAVLGGIGKTELVRKYLLKCSKNYDNILWINAETHETMEASFKQLAREVLGVTLIKDLDVKSVLRKTYSYFAKRSCIFVFDNADTLKSKDGSVGISEFLPSSFLPREKNTPKVLITSRNTKSGSIPQLVLDTFEEQEALDFIKIQLKIKDETQDSDIRNLAQILKYFPLALQQAVAYIKEKNRENNEFKTIDYINIFSVWKETKNLLDYNFQGGSQDLYTETTYKTMTITITKIKENKEYGEIAGTILDIISLLAPDNIPVEMFFKLDLIKNSKDKLSEAIKLLKQYSLINSGQTISQLNVHRLVQQVTRIILEDQNREFFTFKNGFKLLKETIIKKQENYPVICHLLTHTESFLLNLDRWLKRNPKNERTMDLYLELLPSLTKAYVDHGNFKGQKKIQERALEITEKRYGKNHIKFAMKLKDLGCVYGDLCQPKKKIEYLEHALDIITKLDVTDNDKEVVSTLLHLGYAHGDLGQLQQKIIKLEEALTIQKKLDGRDNDIEIVLTLRHLGNAYGDSGQLQQKINKLEEALRIQEIICGRNHLEVANTLFDLASSYGDLGNLQKKNELSERALGITPEEYRRNNFKAAKILVHPGCEPEKKIELLELALKIQENLFGRNHHEVATTIFDLGCVYGDLGQPKKKIELLERALKIQEKHYGRNHLVVAKTLAHLGYASFNGQPEKRIELLERALKIQEKHYGRNNYKLALTLAFLAYAYGDRGDPQKEEELIERALKLEDNASYNK